MRPTASDSGACHCGSRTRGGLALWRTHPHARWKRRNWPCPSQLKTARCPGSEPTNGSLTRCTSSTRRTPTASTRSGGTSSARTSARRSRAPSARPRSATLQPTAPGGSTRHGHGVHRRTQAPPLRQHAEAKAEKQAEPKPEDRKNEQGRQKTEQDRAHEADEDQKTKPSSKAQSQKDTTKSKRPARAPHEQRQADARRTPEKKAGGGGRATSRRYTVLKGAPARTVREHGRQPHRPDRHQRALGAGEAAVGQPHRHQQPPRPRPRRQGVLHPPDRLRAGQGAEDDARDERRLRRGRRQAQPDHAGPHQPRPGHRPAEARRHPPAARAEHQGRGDDGLRALLDRLRGARPQGAQRQARRSPTSRAPRSA